MAFLLASQADIYKYTVAQANTKTHTDTNKIFVNAYTNKSFKMAPGQNKHILHRCHTLSANKAATAVITHEEFEVGLEIPSLYKYKHAGIRHI